MKGNKPMKTITNIIYLTFALLASRLLCAFAASASGLPRRLLNERQHRPR